MKVICSFALNLISCEDVFQFFCLHRFRDDESDSDDEVDWKAISKKIGEYQAEHGWFTNLCFYEKN